VGQCEITTELIMIVISGQQSNGAKIMRQYRKYKIGRMMVSYKFEPYDGENWALDNGAFIAWKNKTEFNEEQFLDFVDYALKLHHEGKPPYFAVCPDIVAGGQESLLFSMYWIQLLPKELKWYLVVQDGMKSKDVINCLEYFHGIFLGGTNEFKQTALYWKIIADYFNKPFHYGRAGTKTKIIHATNVGATSLDSSFPLWTKARWAEFLQIIGDHNNE
jgi:hypothetical protein